MKKTLIAIQNRLAQIPELKYIDRNWGQLQYDNAPVKYPCALVDISSVSYTQMAKGYQRADANINVSIANLKLIRSSSMAPNVTNSYQTIDLLDKVHQNLQLFSSDNHFQPLQRTSLTKDFNDANAEIYTMSYKTSFIVEKTPNPTVEKTAEPVTVKG